MSSSINSLIQKMLSGDRIALARAISWVESHPDQFLTISDLLEPRLGHAHLIGITGPPGAGKSTLVARLVGAFRGQGKTVGVIAVDPSSPFSGGALLGDRIRMMEHAEDQGVFIRSLGSRGAQGGLSRATHQIAQLFDAFGVDLLLVETVGVGQTELDILKIADTTVVVLTPESGDTIQTLKAGLLEAADIFVVNKSDRPGATKMQQALSAMLEMGSRHFVDARGSLSDTAKNWKVPVLNLEAETGKGLEDLLDALKRHRDCLPLKKGFGFSGQAIDRFFELFESHIAKKCIEWLKNQSVLMDLVEKIQKGEKSPEQAVLEIERKVRFELESR